MNQAKITVFVYFCSQAANFCLTKQLNNDKNSAVAVPVSKEIKSTSLTLQITEEICDLSTQLRVPSVYLVFPEDGHRL
jgi:hypothetical protein